MARVCPARTIDGLVFLLCRQMCVRRVQTGFSSKPVLYLQAADASELVAFATNDGDACRIGAGVDQQVVATDWLASPSNFDRIAPYTASAGPSAAAGGSQRVGLQPFRATLLRIRRTAQPQRQWGADVIAHLGDTRRRFALRVPNQIADDLALWHVSGQSTLSWRHGIVGLRNRPEQGDEPRFARQTIAVTMQDRLIARQLELHGNTNCLVAAIAK
jgi:hypothetical protein